MKFNLKNLIQILNKYHPANPQIRQLNYDSFYASVVEFAEGFEKELKINWGAKALKYFKNSYGSREETLDWLIKQILGES